MHFRFITEMNRIQDAVREADVTVVLGFAEHAGGSLYIAQVTITPDGKIAIIDASSSVEIRCHSTRSPISEIFA